MSKTPFRIYREEREKGLTYQQIADKYGVSRQNVGQACNKYNPQKFQFHPEGSIIYPRVLKWMNDNKVSKAELVRRMGLEGCASNCLKISAVLRGKGNPRKNIIDKLLAVTGMSYQEFFQQDVEEVVQHEMDKTS